MTHLCPLSITCQVYRSLWCHGHRIYTNTDIVNKVNYRVEPSKQYSILALHGSIMSHQFENWAQQQLYVIYHINLRIEHYNNTTVQSKKVVSAQFTSKQILLFGFAEQNTVCGVLEGRCFDLVPDLWNLIPIQVISSRGGCVSIDFTARESSSPCGSGCDSLRREGMLHQEVLRCVAVKCFTQPLIHRTIEFKFIWNRIL